MVFDFVVIRICEGHNRLNALMYRKMELAPSPTCNCRLEDQTAEHRYCRYGRFCGQPDRIIFGQQQSNYPKGTGKDGHRLDFQCSVDRDEEEEFSPKIK